MLPPSLIDALFCEIEAHAGYGNKADPAEHLEKRQRLVSVVPVPYSPWVKAKPDTYHTLGVVHAVGIRWRNKRPDVLHFLGLAKRCSSSQYCR